MTTSKIAQVVSSRIEAARRLIKVIVMGKDDVQEINQVQPFGFDSAPIKDSRALHIETSANRQGIIAGYINDNQVSTEGESRMYSTDADGNLKTYIHLHDDGTIEVGGDADNLVRYAPVESSFNALRDKVNELISAYNTHTHITTATVGASPVPGVLSPTTSTTTLTNVVITGAKIEEIKTL